MGTKQYAYWRRLIGYGTLLVLVALWSGGIAHAWRLSDEALAVHQEHLRQQDEATKVLVARLTAQRLKREAAERKETAQAITTAIVSQVEAGAPTIVLPGTLLAMKCNHAREHNDPTRIDVMVNKQHCITPLNYAPSDIVSGQGVTLSRPAYKAYSQLQAAAVQSGISLTPTSSYRSYQLQITSYSDWYRTLGTVQAANEVSALPGYSEHQLGLAVDFRTGGCALECFRSTIAHKWLRDHAHEYGFIERYPQNKTDITGYGAEAWHWRYVGAETATDMRTKKVTTLEEYYDMLGGSL